MIDARSTDERLALPMHPDMTELPARLSVPTEQ